MDVLLDQLRLLPAVPSSCPCRATGGRCASPDSCRRTPPIARRSTSWRAAPAASRRTLERLFHLQTGMSFVCWRQQARLLHAMRRLAGGEPVTTTALEVGYASTSAFIAAFAQVLGTTPGRYCRARAAQQPA